MKIIQSVTIANNFLKVYPKIRTPEKIISDASRSSCFCLYMEDEKQKLWLMCTLLKT